MHLTHDCFPELLCKASFFALAQLCVVVITCPGRTGVVRCVAGEPDIVIIGRRTGFTGDGHAAEVDSSTGTGGDNILHCAR